MNPFNQMNFSKIKKLPPAVLAGGVSFFMIASISTYMLTTYNSKSTAIPTAKVQYQNITSYISATGQLDVDNSLNMQVSEAGQIKSLFVQPGTKVKAGTTILRLDSYELAQKNFDTAKTKVDHLKEISSLAKAKIDSDLGNGSIMNPVLPVDQAAIDTAKAQLTLSQKLADDAKATYSASTKVPDSQVNQAKSELKKASMTVDVNEQAVIQAQNKLISDKNNLSLASQNQLLLDQAAINVAQKQLEVSQYAITQLQNQLNQTQNDLTKTNAAAIQAAKSTLDQQNGVVNLAQLTVSQSQKQLDNDRAANASAGVLSADQAALDYSNQQLSNAQVLASDAQIQYNLALTQTSTLQLASAQTALDQAKGNEQLNETLLAQAQTKLQVDQNSAQDTTVIDQDNASIASATQQLKNAQSILEDAKTAYQSSTIVSPIALANAKTTLDQATGNMTLSESALREAEAKLNADSHPADSRTLLSDKQESVNAEQAITDAELELEKAKLALDESQIVSPVDGVVVSVSKKVGERLNALEQVAVVMPDHPKHQIIGLVASSDVSLVKAGNHVRIESDQMKTHMEGKVRFVSPLPNSSQNQTLFEYAVYIDVDNLPEGMRTGMAVQLKIDSAMKSQVSSVPSEAIFDENGKRGVYLQDQGTPGKFHFQEIVVGVSDDNNVEVTGIKVGDVVALKKP